MNTDQEIAAAVAKWAAMVREYRRYAQHSGVCDNDPRTHCRCGLDDLNSNARAELSRLEPLRRLRGMTQEEKWDRVWIAACGVVAAYDIGQQPGASTFAQHHLMERCATLKRVVDEICPDREAILVAPSENER